MLNALPGHAAARAKLTAFLPQAGDAYATWRNYDLPDHPHVSGLSPYLRHRILTEPEVLRAVLHAHGPEDAQKFVQEVLWRSYWKGWLEMRPTVWADYKIARQTAWDDVQTQSGLRHRWEEACAGQTGIAGFDDWAHELATTGYLHNHARMWFASIWIFTLRLPWALGADFFLRHLLDGDPASNTLSWRWVAGLQTAGKTYLARQENIARFTNNRFVPDLLANIAPPLDGPPPPEPRPCPRGDPLPRAGRIGLLLTEEDLSPDWILSQGLDPVATASFQATVGRSHLHVAPRVTDFVAAAIADCANRHRAALGPVSTLADAEGIANWAADCALDHVVTAFVPVGPTADALSALPAALAHRNIGLHRPLRPFDAAAWPHATKGFFKFNKEIPSLLTALDEGTI